MVAINAFWHLDTRDFHSTNDALMVLLPKGQEAHTIRDYRPISLIHLIGKLISKLLAARLAPRIDSIVHHCQFAFFKGCSIDDSFNFVQGSGRLLHVCRKPSLLFREDLTMAFNSIAWSFLIEVLQHDGFPNT
jgi:hypothetical protein